MFKGNAAIDPSLETRDLDILDVHEILSEFG